MDSLRDDIRLAVRSLWRDTTFSIASILTLSLCIGTNVAVFAVVYHVLLNPLPYDESERVAYLYNSYPKAGVTYVPARRAIGATVPHYLDRLQTITAFETQALYALRNFSVDTGGDAERVLAMPVTPSFFRVLRVSPLIGRAFVDEEGEVGNERRVILSYGLWQRRFAGDPNVLGKTIRIDSREHTIVGVMSRSFEFVEPQAALWTPLAFPPEQRAASVRHFNNWGQIGRLKPGVTIAQAQAQIDALNGTEATRFPQFTELVQGGFRTTVVSLHDDVIAGITPTLRLLSGGTWCVLLIGFINVANLVLLRFRRRLKEIATRLALGASRWRVGAHLVVENLVLASVASLIALAMGWLGLILFDTLNPAAVPRGGEIGVDGPVVLYVAAVLVLLALALSVLPMSALVPASLNTALREENRSGTSSRGARHVRRVLVVAEVAFAFMLLVGAGLLVASFVRILNVDPGFRTQGVMTVGALLPTTSYPDSAAIRRRVDDLVKKIRTIPTVEHAGATTWIPFGALGRAQATIVPGEFRPERGDTATFPNRVFISSGYLNAVGARIVGGRLFEDRDVFESRRVAIVDDRLAKRFWPNEDAVGKRLYRLGDSGIDPATEHLVIGVIGELKLSGLDEPRDGVGTYYLPYAQLPNGQIWRVPFIAVKTTSDPQAITGPLRAAVHEIDPALPLFDARTLQERTDSSLGARRAGLLLSSSLGGVAILLAGIGIYGVVAYWVAQRSREIGVRIALGSSAGGILSLVMSEGLLLTVAGFAIGIAGALALGQIFESQLFDVRASDPGVFVFVTTALMVVAVLACVIPARRAVRTDPVVALAD